MRDQRPSRGSHWKSIRHEASEALHETLRNNYDAPRDHDEGDCVSVSFNSSA